MLVVVENDDIDPFILLNSCPMAEMPDENVSPKFERGLGSSFEAAVSLACVWLKSG